MKAIGALVLACLAVSLPFFAGWIIQHGLELSAGIASCAAVLPFVKA